MKGADGFTVALFFLIITLASYNPIIDLIRAPSLGKVLSVESKSIPQNIEEALRPYKRNGIKLNLSLQFKSLNGSPNQNLFQTDYLNTGIRAELSGGTLAIVINNAENTERPHILIFPTMVSPGKWYELSIQAIENGNISASLKPHPSDGKPTTPPFKINSAKFSISNLMIGSGFDNARKFQGDISNVSISANKVISKSLANYIYFTLVFALLLLTFNLYQLNLKNLPSEIYKFNLNNKFTLRNTLSKFIRFISVALIAISCSNSVLRIYFFNKSTSLVTALLPSFQPYEGTPPYKSELIIFLLTELIFIGWYIFSNLKGSLFEKPNLSKKLHFIPYLSIFYLCLAYLLSPHYFNKALLTLGFIVVTFYTIVQTIIFDQLLKYLSVNIKIINFGLNKTIHFRSIFKKFTFITFAILAIKFFSPLISTWYPVVLPNDYYESVTTWDNVKSKGVIESDALDECIRSNSTSLTTAADKKICQDFTASNLTESLSLLNAWQGESGRILYHHSYVFIPATHYLKHGTISKIPFVYGIGNTMFSAYLMKLNGSSQSISGYFNTIPIVAITGIVFIALLCFYVSSNFLIGFLALFISLGCYYSISYTPVLIAASFNPARFIGIAIQIFSIFYLARSANIFAVILLVLSALFSLFWNFEFGVIGFFGQLSMLILCQGFKNSYQKLFSVALSILPLLLSFKLLKPINADITESINFGLFNIGVPIMPMDVILTTILTIFFAHFILIFINQKQNASIKFAKFSAGIILVLLSVKYFFNPSPPHLYLILLFIAPLYASMMPWSIPNGKTIPAIEALLLSIFFIYAVFFTYNSGEKFTNESLAFHSKFTSNFNTLEWASFGEKIKIVTPEKPIEERVRAINAVLKNENPNVKVLILSPYDHIVSFYVNPKTYCGHFELLTNVLTKNDINTIKKCVENAQYVEVIYDNALSTKCPLEINGSINPGCAKKLIVKNNLVHLMGEIKPLLKKHQTIGDLTFYNKR
uniref:Uncharacterized protein n=1 Tax=Polynucleobacter necessarius subsp. necessarius (strain STIR1) TaxID=452638 RepID=B1XTF8_POLNS